MRIAAMAPADLERTLDWAAAEGWNPGLDDAAAFRAADPEGFLMGVVGDTPVAAISVVRHAADFGFLGLYICLPHWRGRGCGRALWEAGVARLGRRTVGLDGVAAQQANYARSGFAAAWRTLRRGGAPEAAAHPRVRPPRPADLPALLAFDRQAAGVDRPAYIGNWLRDTPGRRSLVLAGTSGVAGFGTIRACRSGHKVGPLYAPDAAGAEALVRALAAAAGAGELVVDMPESNRAAADLARSLGLAPVFETARMYRGPAPPARLDLTFGLATLELG